MQQDRRGILYPEHLPEFHRAPAPAELEHAVRWFWIPEWNLPEGEVSQQSILPFPACNLVVSPDGITAAGPPTRSSERVLEGRGWAVGALLRPASAPAVIAALRRPATEAGDAHRLRLAELRDSEAPIDAPELHAEVLEAMSDHRVLGDDRRARAVAALGSWLFARVPLPRPGSDSALANRLEKALADPLVTRVDQLPELLHTSMRTLQRLAGRFFGLPLHAMIRRRRLQEAAARLRADPDCTIAELASSLGYSDHAHFTTDFRTLLGITPSDYRRRRP